MSWARYILRPQPCLLIGQPPQSLASDWLMCVTCSDQVVPGPLLGHQALMSWAPGLCQHHGHLDTYKSSSTKKILKLKMLWRKSQKNLSRGAIFTSEAHGMKLKAIKLSGKEILRRCCFGFREAAVNISITLIWPGAPMPTVRQERGQARLLSPSLS